MSLATFIYRSIYGSLSRAVWMNIKTTMKKNEHMKKNGGSEWLEIKIHDTRYIDLNLIDPSLNSCSVVSASLG